MPVSIKPRRRDRRYRIAQEYCGYAKSRHVARFCFVWLGQAETRAGARAIITAHKAARDAALTGLAR